MTAPPIRVLIVDDHPLVREGIRQALSAPGFEVVGDAGTGEEGLARARSLRPDVVVLDISLPGDNGLVIAARLRSALESVRVLMLSVHDHPEYVVESIRSGAHGYLRKDSLPDELRHAIRTIHRGDTSFGTALDKRHSGGAPSVSNPSADRLALLTPRERDVLTGIAAGESNKEIAARLDLSVRTVESYRESLVRKLGIPGVAGLTRFALDAGLLPR